MAKPTSLELDDDLKERVEQLASVRRRSADWVMRQAIEQYVEREEKREALQQDTLGAWEEFRASGLHATAEEVERWLASWGSEKELPPPECHE